MTKTEFIAANKNVIKLTFAKKLELNSKAVEISIEEFKQFIYFRYPKLSTSLNFVTSEYIHYHEKSNQGKYTHFRCFAKGILIDGEKYIQIK